MARESCVKASVDWLIGSSYGSGLDIDARSLLQGIYVCPDRILFTGIARYAIPRYEETVLHQI
ncbi:hypothetical protein EB093_00365 [bacterium]|nr:hypothetical protein [bacterium]